MGEENANGEIVITRSIGSGITIGEPDRTSNDGRREGLEPDQNQVATTLLHAREQFLDRLPNDLARLVYLTSLRDYNSGTYIHNYLSALYGVDIVDRAFQVYHQEVFSRFLSYSIEEYVSQLLGYIRYTGSNRATFVRVWKGLQAYRAAIPYPIASAAAERFFANLGTALSILESTIQEPGSA